MARSTWLNALPPFPWDSRIKGNRSPKIGALGATLMREPPVNVVGRGLAAVGYQTATATGPLWLSTLTTWKPTGLSDRRAVVITNIVMPIKAMTSRAEIRLIHFMGFTIKKRRRVSRAEGLVFVVGLRQELHGGRGPIAQRHIKSE